MRIWKTIIVALLAVPLTCSAMWVPDFEVDYLYWGSWNHELLWSRLNLPAVPLSQDTRTSFYLVPEYRSGVRGEAAINLWGDCISLAGRYYFVDFHDTAREVNPGGATLRIPGFTSTEAGSAARIRQDMPYHSADLFVDWGLYTDGCLRFSIQTGGTFAFAKQTIRIDLLDATTALLARARARNRFSGGGPRVGLFTGFSMGCLSLEAEMGVAALLGEQTNVWMQVTPTNVVQQDFTLRTGTGTSAHVHLRFGAKLHRSFRCACAALSLGWEQRNYYNLTSPLTGAVHDVGAVQNIAVVQGLVNDIVFGGPYVGVAVSF